MNKLSPMKSKMKVDLWNADVPVGATVLYKTTTASAAQLDENGQPVVAIVGGAAPVALSELTVVHVADDDLDDLTSLEMAELSPHPG